MAGSVPLNGKKQTKQKNQPFCFKVSVVTSAVSRTVSKLAINKSVYYYSNKKIVASLSQAKETRS